MATVVSMLSPKQFFSSRPVIPDGLKVVFLEHFSDEEIIKACEGAEGVLTVGSAALISSFIIERIPTIKIIQSIGAGFDRVDIPASIRAGIPVANMPGANSTSVAEYVIGSLIALQRRMPESDEEIKAGNYLAFRNRILGEGLGEVRGSRLGLVGFGNIAKQVAVIASLLGASVSYYSSRQQSPIVEKQYSAVYKPLDELLATSDAVSLHVPLNDQTRNLIGAREFALMPRGSILINSARGEVLDQMALAAALEQGHLSGAAIDTFSPEPPGPDHPLLNLSPRAAKHLLLSPHTSGVTLGAFKRMIEGALENIARVARSEEPQNIVNGIVTRVKT